MSTIDQKNEYLVKEHQNLRSILKDLENTIAEIKLEIWIYKTIAQKVEYRILFRRPGSVIHSYDTDCAQLEAKGWHIKRVSECGKYEIWMPLPSPSEKKDAFTPYPGG